MTAGEVTRALDALSAAVDSLLAVEFELLGSDELVAALSDFETQRRRVEAVDVALLAAVDQGCVAASRCRSSTAELLRHQLRVSPGEARRRVRRARDLGPRRAVTGQRLEPIHPLLSGALSAGVVCVEQVEVVTHVLGRVPSWLTVEDVAVCERLLVDAAGHEDARLLAGTGRELLDRLDPDGAEPLGAGDAARSFRLSRRPDGSWAVRGELTDETGLALQAVLDPLCTPRPAVGDPGEQDTRTGEQRAHDGLFELCSRVLRAGRIPGPAGPAVTLLARCELDPPDGADNELHGRLGDVVRTDHGDRVPRTRLARLAGDAAIVPVVLDRTGSDCRLYLGRTQRLANRAQRRALSVRDGGCSFPACDRPASWCEVHHVLAWQSGGCTDIDNLSKSQSAPSFWSTAVRCL